MEEYSRSIDKLIIFYWLGLENDDARFSSDDSGGNENAARYFPLCCWYIYSAGEPDRPVVICDLKAELRLIGRRGRAWIAGHART